MSVMIEGISENNINKSSDLKFKIWLEMHPKEQILFQSRLIDGVIRETRELFVSIRPPRSNFIREGVNHPFHEDIIL